MSDQTTAPSIPDLTRSPDAETIPARFASVVARFADRMALREKDLAWTYRELDERSDRYASALGAGEREVGLKVAIALTGRHEFVAAMLGVLKAGKAVLFLDPSAPESNRRDTCRTFEVNAVIADLEQRPWADFHGVWLDSRAVLQTPAQAKIDPVVSGFDPCLIVQTSGTTGQPLGVVINHRTLLDTIQNYTSFAEITRDDRFTLLTSPTFLAAHTAIFGALLNGAELLPFDVKSRGLRALAAWLQQEALTIYQSTPSLFRALVKHLSTADRFPHLRFLRLGGEPVLASDFEIFQNHFNARAVLANTLGISEAGGNVAYFLMKRDFQPRSQVLPVGLPSRGREIILMDETGHPVPHGQLGEIVVRSEFLASGYYGKEEMTAQRFRSSVHGQELWTGDLGRLTPEGWLDHCGRKDDQVKIRGQRVDLTELGSILRSLDGVEMAVVLVRHKSEASSELVAFLVLKQSCHRTALELREELVKRASSHLIPHFIKIVEYLPLTSGGKIDRKMLLQSTEDAPSGNNVVKSRSPMEKRVADIWEETLGLGAVGVYDNFFTSGGDSLNGLNLLARLSTEFGLVLSPRVLLEGPTVAELTEYITVRRSQRGLARWKILLGTTRSESVVSLRTEGSRLPLFVFPGGAADESGLFDFASMLPYLPSDLPVYGLKQNLYLRTCFPARNIKAMARNYRKDIVRIQPEGPYCLLGSCVASIVMLEVASQLQEAGQTLASMILLNPSRPCGTREWKKSRKLRRYFDVLRRAPLAPFDGLAHVITTFEKDEILKKLGQNPFTPGQVEWIKVPGDHDTYIRQQRQLIAREIARILG